MAAFVLSKVRCGIKQKFFICREGTATEKLRLLIRSDDLGYSEAVNYGIEKALSFGMTRSVGLMPNMSSASHGVELLKNLNVCIGQHTNICAGRPVSNPEHIPSLVHPDGTFKSSREYRSAATDFVALDEAIIEIEAQYVRFKELTGQEPGYFEGHAVRSANYMKAVELVARNHGLKFSEMYQRDQPTARVGTEQAYRWGINNLAADYDAVQCLKDVVLTAERDLPGVYVCHPGYVDDYLMRTSSLNLNRVKEVAMLTDPAVREWLAKHEVELISYDDIGN